ncbi:hypothetical protein D3C78_1834210 [compost metagenome]
MDDDDPPPQGEQALRVEGVAAAGLDAGVLEQRSGLFELAGIDGLGVAVEEVVDGEG